MACPVELHEPPMVDYPVDHGRCELVVAEDGSPFRELDVRREYHAATLVAARHHLEEQPRTFRIEGHVSEFVEYHQVVLRYVPHHRLEGELAPGLRKRQRELGGGVEAHRLPRHHARVADGYREVGLPSARLPVEHEVLRGFDERQRFQVVHAIAVGKGHLREVVPLERLHLGEFRPPEQPRALGFLPNRHLVLDELAHRPQLRRVRRRKEPVDRVVADV